VKKVIVIPSGRRKYMRILLPYLLKAKGLVDAVVLWMNTEDKDDRDWCKKLIERESDFVYAQNEHNPFLESRPKGPAQFFFLAQCNDADTIYVKIDDDICFIAEDAIKNLLACRMQHDEKLMVSGNVINNTTCSFFHQTHGILSTVHGKALIRRGDPVGWASAEFAEYVHRTFLSKTPDEYKMIGSAYFDELEYIPVNAISWKGSDIPQPFDELNSRSPETWFCRQAPKKYKKGNMLCGDAVFAHFAFRSNVEYLEGTDLLQQYEDLCVKTNGGCYDV